MWLTVPPIPTLIIAIALLPISNASRSLSMGSAFWLFVTMIYLSISVTYVICIGKGVKTGLAPLQVLGQGVALLVLPLGLGAPYALSWIGLALSFAGTVILLNKAITLIDRPRELKIEEKTEEAVPSLKEVPLPTLDVDGEGLILGANADMLDLLEVEEDVLLGQKADIIFPHDVDRIDAKGKGWQVLRKPGEGGSEFICLIEAVNLPPAREPEDKGEMFHSPTGLYSSSYANILVPAEIKRSTRYRRWLSMIMIKLNFVIGKEGIDDAAANLKLFNRYGSFIKKNTRECDVAFFMEDGVFLILLPETPAAGAKITVDKLRKVPEEILNNIASGTALSLRAGIYHCSGHEKIDYNGAIANLEENLKELEHIESLLPPLEM